LAFYFHILTTMYGQNHIKFKNDVSVEVPRSQFGPFHTSNPTLLRTILISKHEPYRNTQANDSHHNATRHSYCRPCIYGLPIGCSNCVIYVTCKYMKACCCTQQMVCRLFFTVGERQQVILARPGPHNGPASSLTSTIVQRITNQCED